MRLDLKPEFLLLLLISLIVDVGDSKAQETCPISKTIFGSYYLSDSTPPTLLGDMQGFDMFNIGDVDGDGVQDFAARASRDTRSANFGEALNIFSGKTRTLLTSLKGTSTVNFFGRGTAGIGDINGDGYGDILIAESEISARASAAPGVIYAVSVYPQIKVLYQITAPVLAESTLGHNYLGTKIVALGDLNGDGVSEFAAANPDYSIIGNYALDGALFIYDGRLGQLQNVIYINNDEVPSGIRFEEFSKNIELVGDVTGDGRADLAVSVVLNPDDGEDRGVVLVYDAAALLNRIDGVVDAVYAPAAFRDFGESITALGDLNGDSLSEFAVASPGYISFRESDVFLISPQRDSNGILLNIYGSIPRPVSDAVYFGKSMTSVRDLDGDGKRDLAVSAPRLGSGVIFVYSTQNGNILQTLRANQNEHDDRVGESITLIGDTNGDGFEEIVAGAPGIFTEAINVSTFPKQFNSGIGSTPGAIFVFSLSLDNNKNGILDACEVPATTAPPAAPQAPNGTPGTAGENGSIRTRISEQAQQAFNLATVLRRSVKGKVAKQLKNNFKTLVNGILSSIRANPSVQSVDKDLSEKNLKSVLKNFKAATSKKVSKKSKTRAWKSIDKILVSLIS